MRLRPPLSLGASAEIRNNEDVDADHIEEVATLDPLTRRVAARALHLNVVRYLRRSPFGQIAAERAVRHPDGDAVDRAVRLARRIGERHRVQPRDQVAGGDDRDDGFLAWTNAWSGRRVR